MKYITFLLLLCGLAGCKKESNPTIQEGIIFNPVKPYQEALPGTVITFKVRAYVPEEIKTFAFRVKLPGSTEYVALPQYPDLTGSSEFTKDYGVVEYALPPSATAVTADLNVVKFKFIATTASKSYEGEYTVKMVASGERRARLYSRPASSYFKFSALDLLNSSGVPDAFPSLTKDLVASTINAVNPVTDQQFTLLNGFVSANGSKFKLANVAQYNAVASYATAYNSIAASNEFNGLSTLGANPSTGIGNLVAGSYYIAKIDRAGVISYVGMSMKQVPSVTSSSTTTTGILDLTKEYLEAEIKK